MTNFYDTFNAPGVAFARVMLHSSGKIGGARSVFVDIQGVKNDMAFPSWGGQLKNFPKSPFKIYAGDLFEVRTNDLGEEPSIYWLRTFKVKSMSGTTVKIYRNGYAHIPAIGDVLMKAPSEIGGTGKAYTVTNVVAEQDSKVDVWTLTFNTAIDTVTDGDILVEAESENASGKMLVKNINGVAPCDYDMPIYPLTNTSNENMPDATMFIAPMLHGTMYVHRMSPVPDCVKLLNKSRINGWYEV